jgi:hypothetical protein
MIISLKYIEIYLKNTENIVNVVIFDVYYYSLYLIFHYHFPRIFIIHDNTILGSNPQIIIINEYINEYKNTSRKNRIQISVGKISCVSVIFCSKRFVWSVGVLIECLFIILFYVFFVAVNEIVSYP